VRGREIKEHTIEEAGEEYVELPFRGRVEQADDVRMRCCFDESIELEVACYKVLLERGGIIERFEVKDTVRSCNEFLKLFKKCFHF
jgi:hypothetical protein